MSEKAKSRSDETSPARKGGSRRATSPVDGGEKEVRYFLRLLGQVSLALQRLGYPTEGIALAQVENDLENRIFGTAGRPSVPAEAH